jgi:ATP-binding cassette subfamily E protein 1
MIYYNLIIIKKMGDSSRIAIINADKCKPKNCSLECKKKCPSNAMGKMCIEVVKESKAAIIHELLCVGCNICVKQCPYDAISIINLPKELSTNPIHRYGPNQFKLFGLPTPRPNQVLGLVGINGIGKSTALKILAGNKPNLGCYDNPPSWEEILVSLRGTELQHYFTKLLEDKLVAKIKPQYVDQIPRAVKGTVYTSLLKRSNNNNINNICEQLDLIPLYDRDISALSGGELQRFAIAALCVQEADIYLFDEPSSYLDIKQRLKAAHVIRSMVENNVNRQKYVVVIEHDLSVLDYLSDYICILWGVPGSYGSVTMPFSVRDGINIFLDGFIPTENLRFRDEALTFKITDGIDRDDKRTKIHYYPSMTKTLGDFSLVIQAGEYNDAEIIVMLGQNGCGKSTFIRMLAGKLKDDYNDVPELKISYKPQKISPTFDSTVRNLLFKNLGTSWQHTQFQKEVFKPLKVEELLDNDVKTLSGGELQRVALVLALGKPADIYLIDEPSAYLDSEQRVIIAKVIKRFIINARKTAFIVEHDFIMATYMADRVIVYDGTPSVKCTASPPQKLVTGMNQFLKQLDITLRRDQCNYRPRINKHQSQMDVQQKQQGNYFHHD